VSAFTAGQEGLPRPAVKAIVEPLYGALSAAYLPRKTVKSPVSKTEQEKGGRSCATTHRERSPAVLGVSGIRNDIN